MVYDVVKAIRIPARAMFYEPGETVRGKRLGRALVEVLLADGAIVEHVGERGIAPADPDPVDEMAEAARLEAYMRYSYPNRYADAPEQEVEPLTEPEPEPVMVEEEDDDGR